MNETIVDETFIAEMEKYRVPKKELGLIGACSENVVVFAEKMLGIKLYAWQVKLLTDMQIDLFERKKKYCSAYYDETGNYKQGVQVEISSPEYVIDTSRQIGKSTAAEIFGWWCVVFNHAPMDIGRNSVVGIASISDDQAKMLLGEIKKLIIIGDAFMANKYVDGDNKPTFGNKFFTSLLDTTKGNSADSITLKPYTKNIHGDYLLKDSKVGSSLFSYPPTTRVLGNKYSLIIEDECGKSEKMSDEFHFDYMRPTGNAHFALRMYISTSWQCAGFFFKMIDPSDMYGEIKNLKKYMFTIDAIRLENPTYYSSVMEDIRKMNADGRTNEVQRGYYCRFIKGDTNFFDPEDVNSCFKDYAMYLECKEECDLGIDFGGQTKSKTILTISKVNDKGEVMRLWHKTYDVQKDDTVIEDIRDIRKYFNNQRIITEDIPQADYMIRKMKDLGWEVYAMVPRAEKVKKYTAFRAKLHRGEISTYLDADLKEEMLALETNTGSQQSKIEHAPGYRDDMIDSWLLSCYFFINDEKSFTFYSLPKIDTTIKKIRI